MNKRTQKTKFCSKETNLSFLAKLIKIQNKKLSKNKKHFKKKKSTSLLIKTISIRFLNKVKRMKMMRRKIKKSLKMKKTLLKEKFIPRIKMLPKTISRRLMAFFIFRTRTSGTHFCSKRLTINTCT
jgi:hypothetical protein